MNQMAGIPIFSIVTTDKVSGKKVYFNFRCSSDVPKPNLDFTEDQIMKEWLNPQSNSGLNYDIPLTSSPMFWPKSELDKLNNISKEVFITPMVEPSPDSYVIEIKINDSFALKKVLASEIILHYLVAVTLSVIMDKYNKDNQLHKGEFIGHELDFDFNGYERNKEVCIENSFKFVNNKVALVKDSTSNQTEKNANDLNYDLYYRPSSKVLTCCIKTDVIPTSISFNDDRIVVKTDSLILMDLFLPFYINLSEPVRYKYDYKTCLLRIVAKVTEDPEKAIST